MLSHYDFWTKVQPSNSLGRCYGHTEVMMMADRPSEWLDAGSLGEC